MKILELTRYFVDRYKLEKKLGYENENEEIATYRTAITRILKNKKIQNKSLWDLIKPEKGSRQISLEDFMKYCFPEWKKYLYDNYIEDLEENDTLKYLEEDVEEYLKSNEWYLKAEGRIQRHNKAIEEYDPVEEFEEIDDEIRYGITTYYEGSKEVLEKALQFQIQALFELYFEELNLKEIAKDMTLISNCDTSYNPTYTEKEDKAFNRIASYKNYTKRKQ